MYPSIVFQRDARLIGIGSLDKYELVFPYFIENTLETFVLTIVPILIVTKTHHIVPCSNDGFHVQVTREEGHDAIRDNLAVFNEDASKISNNRRIIPDFKAWTDGNLVTATSNDLNHAWWQVMKTQKKTCTNQRKERISCHRHRVGLLHDRGELEHFWIHVQRWNCSRCDDHAAEALKNRFYGDRWV